LYVRIIGPSP
jgi:hypothetical protein